MAGSSVRIGTYVAEVVATSSFDLMNVSQSGFDRPFAEKVQGAEKFGRRRKPRESGNFKATLLPALVSIDPLLQRNEAEAEEEAAQRSSSTEKTGKEFERWHRSEELKISSARMHRGWPVRGEDRLPMTDRPMTRGDVQAIAALTQPLPWFSQQRRDAAEAAEASHGRRKKRVKAEKASDLFRLGLRGTDLENSTSTVRMYKRSANSPSRGDEPKLTLTEQHLLPEDPVEAYFTAEAERRAEREAEARKEEEEKKRGKGKIKTVMKSDQMEQARKVVREEQKENPTTNHVRPVNQPELTSLADVVVAATVDVEKDRENPNRYLSEVIDQLYPKQKVSPVRRELCAQMRLFVLGSLGNENARGKKDREAVFFQTCGTKQDMSKLLDAWDQMDEDGHGKVDASDLRSFGDRIQMDVVASKAWSTTISVSGKSLDEVSGRSRLPGWLTNTPIDEREKFAQRLCERMATVLLNPRKPAFRLEDVMRLVWCGASNDDLRQMRSWCDDLEAVGTRDKYRCSPPPVLPQEEKNALQAVFQSFDSDGGGTVTASELISSGLMDIDSARKFISEVDQDGSGEIDMDEFCELMCPHGFRAHESSEVGSTPLGKGVKFFRKADTWRLKDAPPLHTPAFAERLSLHC
mmetsp:Transcript_22102/g.39657  ORF Transcript_22102/g.39657 Transcript_22102/m.39657 type:complete len:635 (-) Transcript_22102:83-1987(-)